MKQNYLLAWISACLFVCLSLCGNVSAQNITSFDVKHPPFVPSTEFGRLDISVRNIDQSTGFVFARFYYNDETGLYETTDLLNSGEYLIGLRYHYYDETNTQFLPYYRQQHITVGATTILDIQSVYHKCDVSAVDFYGNPVQNTGLTLSQRQGSSERYQLNQEGRLSLYMPNGQYDFELSVPDYLTLKRSVTIAGADLNVKLDFAGYRKVDFNVKDQKGSPLANANINVSIDEQYSGGRAVTNEQGKATLFLPDGNYRASASVPQHMVLNKDLVVNNSTKAVDFSFEHYKRISFNFKKGSNVDIAVDQFSIYSPDEEHNGYSQQGDYYYVPSGVYYYDITFNATLPKRGMVKVGDVDVEKQFDFSMYKNALIACGQHIQDINIVDPTSDRETGLHIQFPSSVNPEDENPVQHPDKIANVYLPAGTYTVNAYDTPQTGMDIKLVQDVQTFVYDRTPLELVQVSVNFINYPDGIDLNKLSSRYNITFTPKGYTSSLKSYSGYIQIPADDYTYVIEGSSYSGIGFSKEGTARIDAANNVIEVDLKGYHQVSFNILNPDGEVEEYPIVNIFRNERLVSSDEGSHYLLEDGDYKVLIWSENDSEMFQKELLVTVSGANQVIQVQLERTHTTFVSVKVRNENYELVENARITIEGKVSSYVHEHMSLFTDVSPGENRYQVSAEGYHTQIGTLNVKANEMLAVTLFLETVWSGIGDAQESKLAMVQYGDRLMLFSEDEKPYSVSIYNMNGSKLLEKSMNGNDEVSIESLGSGVYILKMAGTHCAKTFKFVRK